MSVLAILRFFVILLVMALIAMATARALTAWSIKLANARNLLAPVNDRSSHRTPTPRIGGIGLTAGLLVAFAILAFMLMQPAPLPAELKLTRNVTGALTWTALAGWVGSLLIAFALGFGDDLKNPHPILKLIGQFVAALIPVLCGLRLTRINLPGVAGHIELPLLLGGSITILWIVILMNAVNFMDGINGLAGRFAQIVAIFTFLATFNFAGAQTILPLAACLYGAAEGFLRYNIPNARTFMGDCGSQPLGLFVALLGIHLSQLPTSPPLASFGFVLIVSPFIFDVLLTILRRATGRRNLLAAHREHLYQRHLVSSGEDHMRTLHFVDNHLFATGALGAFYIHFCGASPQLQLLVTALTGATLLHYAWRALKAEKAPASAL